MATVWCAEDTRLERQVAIKLLSGALIEDATAQERFAREARTVAALSAHPHVVRIFDVGETEDLHRQPYIVMAYLPGGTVAQALAAGPVPRERALDWVEQAAAALDAAHALGVIHRDVKPANLLLDADGRLAVADFGIARLSDEATITGSQELCGTAAYLAPEQVAGIPASPASDRYALAVMAYELLTGRRPFAGEGFAAQARARLDAMPPSASAVAPGLPRAIDPVLDRGLARRPAERWPSAGAFALALRRAAGEPALAAGPPTVPHAAAVSHGRPGAGPGRPRARRLVAGAALLAALLLALAVVLTSGPRSARHPATVAAAHAPPPRRPTSRRTARPAPAVARPAPPTVTGTTTVAGTTTIAGTAPAAGSADALEARGHALLAGGDPAAALPVLRQAIGGAPPAA